MELPERSRDWSKSLSRFVRSPIIIASSYYARKWQPDNSSTVRLVFSFIKVQRWPTISLSFIFNYWNWSLVNDYPSVAMASVRTLKSFNYLTVTLDKLNSFRHLTVDLLPNSRNEYIEFMLLMPISLLE